MDVLCSNPVHGKIFSFIRLVGEANNQPSYTSQYYSYFFGGNGNGDVFPLFTKRIGETTWR
jgi:hypothetical protein